MTVVDSLASFCDFSLPADLLTALKGYGYVNPTPVQSSVIPLAVSGRDVLGSSQTGTGKTAAFMIPVLAMLLSDPSSSALVIAPTRELASQIALFARKLLAGRRDVFVALLIGGEGLVKQFIQLDRRPRLIVGTPGRICDHMDRGKLSVSKTGLLVLDETDRMLDMGFSDQINAIVGSMPVDRQTLMFSATIPKNIVSLSSKYMRDPVVMRVGSSDSAPTPNVKQEVAYVTSHHGKYEELLRELDKRSGSVIVFVKTKLDVSELADKLFSSSHSVGFIHGDLRQAKRDKAIKGFRDKRYRVMVATDVASRGLDIPHIEHVINYDVPQCVDDYIHRVGRTARAGKVGSSLVFVTPSDRNRWNEISRVINGGARRSPVAAKVGNKRFKTRFGSRNGARQGFARRRATEVVK